MKWLKKKELARELHVSLRTIDKLMAQRKIPYYKLSSHLVRFNLERVKEHLEANYTLNAVTHHDLPRRRDR